jgi:glycosyltransferase involved in cell wall biosynthesis
MVQVLGRALVQAGHEVRVVGCYPLYTGPEYEEDRGVRVWRFPISGRRSSWIAERIKIFRVVAGWSRQGEIDLVEAPDYQGLAAGWPRLSVPVVARLHGSLAYFAAEMNQRVRRGPFLLERASMKRADFWCSVSRYTAEKTQQIFGMRPERPAILYNPVEYPTKGSGHPRSSRNVVFSGTLVLKKGVTPLFQAWAQVAERCPEAVLHVFGKDGRTAAGQSMKSYLLSLLPNRAARTVFFHGHTDRSQLFQAYETARLAVFPSYAEAFAVAPLEAMAWGCPTLYSSRGSGPELIDDGETGLLVNPDRPDQIAASILEVLSNDTLAGRLGENGRDLIRRAFSTGTIVNKNLDFYRNCASRFERHSLGWIGQCSYR